jgi:16S rRNA (cytosine1402-N4)-methyltransferase
MLSRRGLDSRRMDGYPVGRDSTEAIGPPLPSHTCRLPLSIPFLRCALMSVSGSGAVPRHLSVLPAEVLSALAPAPGQVIVDCTSGAGGHARLIAERLTPNGRLIALDRDSAMLDLARPRLEGLPVTLVQAGFDELPRVLREMGIESVDGVLADLGICSDQLDDPTRGFGFSHDGPLDMRMNPDEGEPASDLLRRLNERDLADIIFRYGEERFSRRIARRIVEVRRKEPLETTGQLADLVRRCVPRGKRQAGKKAPIDPATRTFQALRIAVNDEMRALENLLEALPGCLKPGGRAVLISFHSLEDRQVKQAFRNRDIWEEITRKPITAGDEETANNPRSRSAKLRAARRLPLS